MIANFTYLIAISIDSSTPELIPASKLYPVLPGTGLEPVRELSREILSLLRLPIPPSRQAWVIIPNTYRPRRFLAFFLSPSSMASRALP